MAWISKNWFKMILLVLCFGVLLLAEQVLQEKRVTNFLSCTKGSNALEFKDCIDQYPDLVK